MSLSVHLVHLVYLYTATRLAIRYLLIYLPTYLPAYQPSIPTLQTTAAIVPDLEFWSINARRPLCPIDHRQVRINDLDDENRKTPRELKHRRQHNVIYNQPD